MITITRPYPPLHGEIGYWSLAVEALIRNEGLISVCAHPVEGSTELVLPGAPRRLGGSAVYELDGAAPEELGSGWSVRDVEWLDVDLGAGIERNELRLVRVRSEGESVVQASVTGSPWGTSGLRVMLPPAGWTTVLGSHDSAGVPVPVLVQRGDTLALTCPLFGLAVMYHSFPPLSARYAGVRGRLSSRTFACLIDLIGEHHMRFGTTALVKIARWPLGFDSCLTVRLDYDREISDESLDELVSWIEDSKVGCSFGALDYLRPPHQLRRLVAAGVEIQMHASGEDQKTIEQHRDSLRAAAQYDVVGATVHGGPSGIGYRGDDHLRYFAAAGFKIGEVIGLESHSPAPVVRPAANGPEWSPDFTAPPRHLSLDGSTDPEDHRREQVVKAAKRRLANEEHAVIMNHPDIHREQLFGTIAAVTRAGVWNASIREVANWVQRSRLEAISFPDGSLEVRGLGSTAQVLVSRPGKPAKNIQVSAD